MPNGPGLLAARGRDGTRVQFHEAFATEVMACLDVLTKPEGPARCGGWTGMHS
jgi:hypothetical protein